MPAISRTWVLIAIGLLQLPLCGQQNVGSIKGTVRDPSGAIMPGVSAVVRDQATGVETKTTTNETGAYEFLGLGIGEYTLTVSAPGFKTTETPDIRLVAGSILTFDLKLTLGAVTERVTVSARAAPLDTSSTTMGTTVTSEQLRNLRCSSQDSRGARSISWPPSRRLTITHQGASRLLTQQTWRVRAPTARITMRATQSTA